MSYADILDSNYYKNDPIKKEPETYANKLDNTLYADRFDSIGGKVAPARTFGKNTGFGDSIFDDPLMLEHEFDEIGIDEIRAQNQPWIAKVGAGAGRFLNSFITNVAEIPGFIGGTVAAAGAELFGEGASMDMVVNNWWSQLIKKEQDWFNNEAMPVYVKKAVQEGNLWDNISSVDFWATEGADGAAFMAAAFAPGAAMKAFGTGAKIASLLGKTSKGLDKLKYLDEVFKAKGLGNTAEASNVLGATLVNTLYEAGKEAQGALEGYDNILKEKLENGDISEGEYQELYKKRGEQASKVFKDNFGILLIPNLIMSKALFGKYIPKNAQKAFVVNKSGKITKELVDKTFKEKAKDVAKLVGGMTAQEGFFEEGMQMTSEKYRTEDFLNKDGESLSFLERYAEVVGSTEGAKAIFLGGFLGSIAGGVGKYRANKEKKKRVDSLEKILQNGSNVYEASINGIYKKDDKGEFIKDKDGQKIKDEKLATDLGVSIDNLNAIAEARDLAVQEGNKLQEDYLNNEINTQIATTFIKAGEEGIELLKNYLTHSTGLDKMVEEYNKDKEKGITKNDFINEFTKKAESLKDSYEDFTNYGEYYSQLDEFKDETIYNSYLDLVRNSFVALKSRDDFFKKEIGRLTEKLNNKKSEIEENNRFLKVSKQLNKLKEEGVIESEVDEKEVIDAIKTDLVYNNIKRKVDVLTENRKENLKDLAELQDPEQHRKNYIKLRKDNIEKQAKLEKGEDKEVNKSVAKVKKAKNKKELSEVEEEVSKSKVSPSSKAHVKKKIEEKEEILDKEEQITEQTSKENIKKENKDTKTEKVKVGERISYKGVPYDVEGIKEGKVILTNLELDAQVAILELPMEDVIKGMSPIKKTTKFEPSVEEPSSDSSTENKNKNEKIKKEFTPKGHTHISLQDYYQEKGSDFKDWQETPIDKVGQAVSFRFPTEYKDTSELIEILKDPNLTKPEFNQLVDDIAINVVVGKKGDSSIFTPINAKNNTTLWETHERPFREKLLQAFIDNGYSFEGLNSKIAFQYGGDLMLTPLINGKKPKNKLTEIKGFENIDDIELITVVNTTGKVRNDKGKEYIPTDFDLSSSPSEESKLGKIYMVVKTAEGRGFPLRLNRENVNIAQANAIVDIYTELLNNDKLVTNSLVSRIEGPLKDKIEKNLKKELAVLNAKYKNPRIKDLIDLVVFKGTIDSKGLLEYKKDRIIVADGETSFNSHSIVSHREDLVNWITENRSQHIKFLKNKGATISLADKVFKEYIINNGILHTDAITGEPLFQGNTKVFIESVITKKAKPITPSKSPKKSKENIRNSNKKSVSSQKPLSKREQLLNAAKKTNNNKTEC